MWDGSKADIPGSSRRVCTLAARTCAKTTIFASEIKPIWAVQPFAQKISLNPSGKSVILVGASHANEGRLAIVTNVAVRCGGRDVRD
jgi:hypothetical protein